MSYILDALRKSESERHQGEVPNLGANPMLIHARRDERPLWPYILIAVLVLNALVVGVWLFNGQSDKTTSESSVPNEAVVSTHVTQVQPSLSQPPQVTEAVPSGAYAQAPLANNSVPPASAVPGAIPGLVPHASVATSAFANTQPAFQYPQSPYSQSQQPLHQQEAVAAPGLYQQQAQQQQLQPQPMQQQARPQPERAEQGSIAPHYSQEPEIIRPSSGINRQPPGVATNHDRGHENDAFHRDLGYMDDTATKQAPSVTESLSALSADTPAVVVPRLEDMPVEFQRRVPTMRFNSHIYSSDASARRVMINNIYLREGQSFSGGVVQEITEEGVVMVMDGVMFEINAARDWVRQ